MPTLSDRPEWASEDTAINTECMVDRLITDRIFSSAEEPIVSVDKLGIIADIVMATLYATIDAQVVVYQNEMAYAGVQR